MADYRVDCITPDQNDDDRRIDALGGTVTHTGGRWYDGIDNVIAAIKCGHTFWTMVGLYRVDVFIRRHPRTLREYLTTDPDGHRQNNLLNLLTCRL